MFPQYIFLNLVGESLSWYFLLITTDDWKIRLVSSKIKRSSVSIFEFMCLEKFALHIHESISTLYILEKLLIQILMSYPSKEFSFSEDKSIHDLQIATS